MKKKNYHLFIVAFFIFDYLIRFRAAYSHGSLEKHPVVGNQMISGVEGHELVWLQSDR
jgi:hypothetical protein